MLKLKLMVSHGEALTIASIIKSGPLSTQSAAAKSNIIAQASNLGNNSKFSRHNTRPLIWCWGEIIMDGIHLLGEWYGCKADTPEMTHVVALRDLCLRLASASGMTVVGDSFHQFSRPALPVQSAGEPP
jgi:hypothetical protein